MKFKKMLVASGLVLGLFLTSLGVLSTNATPNSLDELGASATDYCANCGSCAKDCASGATGHVYPHHEKASY